MLRWTIRVVLVFAVLIVVAAVIVHFVLQSTWLGDMILVRAGEAIGMEVASESLDVGWDGSTIIRDAVVKMPLTGEVVLSADRIEIKHEVIPLLILGRPVRVRLVQVDRPQVNLHHDESGRWNVQDVWTRLRASLDSVREPDGRRRGVPALPQIVIQDAMLRITEPNAAAQTVGPLGFRARPQGQLLWQFDLELPEVLGVEGRLVPGSDWAHQVGFAMAEVEPLVHRLLGRELSPVHVTGRWEGKVLEDGVNGTLRLDKVAIGPVAAHGEVLVGTRGGRITISPRDLVLLDPNAAQREVRLAGGSVQVAGNQLEVQRLAVVSGPLTTRLTGAWDWSARVGEFSGSLAAVLQEPSAQYNGTFTVSVKSPEFGRKAVRASASAQADGPLGQWRLAAEVEASGADWRQSQWLISLPTMHWSREGRQVDLAGASAEVRLAWPEVRLSSLRVPGAETTITTAQFDADTRRWMVRLEAKDVRQLEPWGVSSLNLRLDAEGDDRKAVLSDLRVVQDVGIARASGELSFRERGFQNLRLVVDWPADELTAALSQPEPTIGRWRLEGAVLGRFEPPAVEMTGDLIGRNVVVGKQTLSRIEIPVRVAADARQVRMTSEPFELLGGQWRLEGHHELADASTELRTVADGLSLQAAAGLAGLPLTSQGRAQARVQMAMRRFDPNSIVATGQWSAEDIYLAPLRAREARGSLRVSDGLVRFDDIVVRQEQGQVEAAAQFRLDKPETISVEVQAKQWPVHSLLQGEPNASGEVAPRGQALSVAGESPAWLMYADGRAKLQVDAARQSVEGLAQVSGTVRLLNPASRIPAALAAASETRDAGDPSDFARIRMAALIQENTLHVRDLYAETLGGSVQGEARIPLDHWQGSSASLKWQGIVPNQLEPWAPPLGRLEGVVSGSLDISQVAQSARPLEPMQFVLDADIEDGRFGPAQVDVCRIRGYVGDTRLLIDEARLRVLGGQLTLRARVTEHAARKGGAEQAPSFTAASAARYHATVVADFNELDLDQLVHVFDPNAGEFPGHLSGTATLLGSSSLNSFGGEARILLAESDLASSSVVGALYNTLKLNFGRREPTGTGDVTIRLEGPSVVIPSFTYFNQGVEIRGAGRIEDINLGARSPVDGFVVASTRVLRGVRLPGVRALDRLMSTFQAGAASARVRGTLEAVEVGVVPLPEVLGSFRNLLWAQLRE